MIGVGEVNSGGAQSQPRYWWRHEEYKDLVQINHPIIKPYFSHVTGKLVKPIVRVKARLVHERSN